MLLPDSPFSLPDRVILESDGAFAFFDKYAVFEGHPLIIPKSIFARFSERPPSLESALWVGIQEYRDRLRGQYHPEGFSIGINDGRAAGQTIEHAHVHVIPRYEADAASMHWPIAEKTAYWCPSLT